MAKIQNFKTRFRILEFRILNLFRISSLGFRISRRGGFGLLEIIIASALISVSLFSFSAVAQISLKASRENLRSVKAAFLAEEGMEALRLIRDDGWANISSLITTTGRYHFLFSEGVWSATTAPQTIDGIFERSFVLEPVYRDPDDNIADVGDLDIDARRVFMRVSIDPGAETKELEFVSYITNLFES